MSQKFGSKRVRIDNSEIVAKESVTPQAEVIASSSERARENSTWHGLGASLVSFVDVEDDEKEVIPEKQVNFRIPLNVYKELDKALPHKMTVSKFYRKLTMYYLEQKKQGSISF